ncbi:hypothetical protein RT0835 [Rickettsia typhi str. Wilmington]|uniref:Uncharacterized protein n=1 Tax=Rickettsia typhi (strain ATCC VR-144 / Wilmington) TaxID=257363 RepID=Q68VR7_RICTY|nr:hypothetical protein RT0835 [Rickettsia typhi str. Wilmington]AFE55505.1 hypothetical protein RTB9991CWPP_04010 [Rickettsia typhi str. B9991CWPP]
MNNIFISLHIIRYANDLAAEVANVNKKLIFHIVNFLIRA